MPGAVVAALVGVPALGAGADHTPCYSGGVYTGGGPDARTSDALVGVCAREIGYVEAGSGARGSYVVASHDQRGYVGVSNYETGSEESCGSDSGSGTNSGGCYGTRRHPVVVPGAVHDVAPTPVCGNTSGSWGSSSRDGCRPAEAEIVDSLLPHSGVPVSTGGTVGSAGVAGQVCAAALGCAPLFVPLPDTVPLTPAGGGWNGRCGVIDPPPAHCFVEMVVQPPPGCTPGPTVLCPPERVAVAADTHGGLNVTTS